MSQVTLKWITPSAEEIIVNIARVSNPKNRDNYKTAPQLIKYLIKNKHWSPFEMANMCVEITTSRAISAQIIRHRSFSFQEYSQRYAKAEKPGIPKLRRQDTQNRQSSHDDLTDEIKVKHYTAIDNLFSQTYELYESMLADGVAKETARAILPMCTETTIIMNGTIRSWLHYISIRGDVDTQLEHRQIALAAKQIIQEQLPSIYAAYFV
jgi:thymidylate synthase (FAD)